MDIVESVGETARLPQAALGGGSGPETPDLHRSKATGLGVAGGNHGRRGVGCSFKMQDVGKNSGQLVEDRPTIVLRADQVG